MSYTLNTDLLAFYAADAHASTTTIICTKSNLTSLGNLGVPPTGSPPYGLRFARCFARFAPTGGSRKNLHTEAKNKPLGMYGGVCSCLTICFHCRCFAPNENLDVSCWQFFRMVSRHLFHFYRLLTVFEN